MTSPFLTTLFSTLAQVSFTVSGLMAVAIAGDSKRRDYWFGHESRSLFVYISFLLLLLPGFISIGGLIPPSSQSNIPSWPFAAFFIGFIYSMLSIAFRVSRNKLAEPEEFRRLEIRFFSVTSEMVLYSFGLIFLAFGGYISYVKALAGWYDLAETVLGIMLFLSMMTGAIDAVILLRSNELPNKVAEVTPISPASEQHILVTNQKVAFRLSGLVILLTAIISFFIGLLVKRNRK